MSKVKKNKQRKLVDYKWILTITSIAFIISIIFSFISEIIIPNTTIVVSIILVLFFIVLGVIFDMVGVASTAAEASQFHSMASKKIKSAKVAIMLIGNSDRVSSICCDVVGDICGIISGSGAAAISAMLVLELGTKSIIPALLVTSITAALTIGGKAMGKGFAVNKSNNIVNSFSKVISPFVKLDKK